jgi:hypothetical protein
MTIGTTNFMKSTRKTRKPVPAEAIARLADQGRDVSRFFTNAGRMMAAISPAAAELAMQPLKGPLKSENLRHR